MKRHAALTTEQRKRAVDAITSELITFGYPLHGETVAQMVTHRHPELFGSSEDVLRVLASESDRFENLGAGVFGVARLDHAVARNRRTGEIGWPDEGVATVLGCLCGRGRLDLDRGAVVVTLRYGGAAYSYRGRRGLIGKGAVAFVASDVVPEVATTIAQLAATVMPGVRSCVHARGAWSYDVELDCGGRPTVLGDLVTWLHPGDDFRSFAVPADVFDAELTIQRAFVRGFGLVCGLVSSGTNLFGQIEQVWLRPDTGNKAQFHQIIVLLSRMGIGTYWNDRNERDIAVKVRCEDWMSIGFGVEWLDALVAEGARMNRKRLH